jgi:hypothetical protein
MHMHAPLFRFNFLLLTFLKQTIFFMSVTWNPNKNSFKLQVVMQQNRKNARHCTMAGVNREMGHQGIYFLLPDSRPLVLPNTFLWSFKSLFLFSSSGVSHSFLSQIPPLIYTTWPKVCGHLQVEHLISKSWELIWILSPLCCYNSLHFSVKAFH